MTGSYASPSSYVCGRGEEEGRGEEGRGARFSRCAVPLVRLAPREYLRGGLLTPLGTGECTGDISSYISLPSVTMALGTSYSRSIIIGNDGRRLLEPGVLPSDDALMVSSLKVSSNNNNKKRYVYIYTHIQQTHTQRV